TTVDLSAYRDADGSCELTDLALEGKTALVLAQRLENFFPTRSYVLQIDTLTHQLIGDIVLDGREGRAPSNPIGKMKKRLGSWWVSAAGQLAFGSALDGA